MDIKHSGNNLIVTGLKDFNLKHIFECGQCFRFNEIEKNTYLGIAKGNALCISQDSESITLYETTEEDFKNIWYEYFDLGRDYSEIKKRLSVDPIMKNAISYGDGIRILNQDLWETVISFIISASNNIPRIKGIIERFCTSFGKKINYMGKTYYSFPDIDTVYKLSKEDLSVIRAGYRDKYIMDAAQKFQNGHINDGYIRSLTTPEAKKMLLTINGVGEKVCNCILLFGLQRVDSFPIDVWIKRIVEKLYFGEVQNIPTIAEFAKKHFGDIGGFAQQYLFFYARENKI